VKESEVRERAFAMPLTSPAFPPGPYRFVNREFFIVTYRTDPELLRAVIPAPLEMTDPVVKYEFIRMPDSTGFGDYTESGQVIPVSFRGQRGAYVHAMYLNDHPPIAGG
jgi:acetoacetate decarboxylase